MIATLRSFYVAIAVSQYPLGIPRVRGYYRCAPNFMMARMIFLASQIRNIGRT